MRNAIFMTAAICLACGCEPVIPTTQGSTQGDDPGAEAAPPATSTTQTASPTTPAPTTPQDRPDEEDLIVVADGIPVTPDDPIGPYCDCPSTHPGHRTELFDTIRVTPGQEEVVDATSSLSN